MRTWTSVELSRLIERFGCALLHTAKRIETSFVAYPKSFLNDGTWPTAPMDLSGSPAEGNARGGRRWNHRALMFSPST